MIVLGAILLVLGVLLGIHLLATLGTILLVIGLILLAVSFIPSGPLAGRRFY